MPTMVMEDHIHTSAQESVWVMHKVPYICQGAEALRTRWNDNIVPLAHTEGDLAEGRLLSPVWMAVLFWGGQTNEDLCLAR